MAEPPSPFTPHLNALIELARMDWRRWRTRLLDAVVDLLQRGRMLPMDVITQSKLAQLLAAHEHEMRFRFSGRLADPVLQRKLLAEGKLPGKLVLENPVAMGFKTGLLWNPTKLPPATPHIEEPGPELNARIKEAIKIVRDVPLSKSAERAMDYAQRRAGEYMIAPVRDIAKSMQVTVGDLERQLTQAELQPIRELTPRAIRERWSNGEFKRKLWDAIDSPRIINDIDRVVRTEMVNAQSEGAAETLREKAKEIGQDDPLVYKLVSPEACEDCKRIWGEIPNVKPIRMSQLIANGSNYGRKKKDWLAVVGTIHPNCTEPPVMIYHERIIKDLVEMREELIRKFGK